MGTRNLTMVYFNNEYKVAQYGQWDGYLSYTGANILKFLKKYNLDYFKEKLNNVSFYTDEEERKNWEKFAISKEINSEDKFVDYAIIEEYNTLYPTLNRDIGSNILEMIADSENPLKLRDETVFAEDSLFCEYAYVIDLDKNTFEIYTGFNKEKLSENDRFFFLQEEGKEYYPVKLLKSYPLSELPTQDELIALDEE